MESKLGGPRPGSGRPPLSPEKKKYRLTLWVSKTIADIAASLGRDRVNEIVSERLKDEGK